MTTHYSWCLPKCNCPKISLKRLDVNEPRAAHVGCFKFPGECETSNMLNIITGEFQ